VDQLLAQESPPASAGGPESAGETAWSLADHLGTIRDLVRHDALTNSVQSLPHRAFDAYGNETSSPPTSALDTLFAFTGRLFDAATGLQNNLNRWYVADVGRWVSEDPIRKSRTCNVDGIADTLTTWGA
jgi:RHS repeat-associated protein